MTWFIQILWLIIVIVTGLGSLAVGIYLAVEAARFRWRAVRVVGTVVRIASRMEEVAQSAGTDSTYYTQMRVYYPVFAFVDANGTTREAESNFGSTRQKCQIGDEVRIWYNPADTTKIRIDRFWSLYGGILVCFSGAIASLVMLGFFRMMFHFWPQ